MKGHLIALAGGMVISSVLKTKVLRKAAVVGVAKTMLVKDEAVHAYNKVREEAENIYEEAKEQNGCSCGCEGEEV